MKKKLVLLSSVAFIFCGCVSQAKYKEALFNLEQSEIVKNKLKQENEKMSAEIERLEERNEYIKKVSDGFEERASSLDKYMRSSKNGKDKILAGLASDKRELKDKLNKQDIELKGLRDQNRKLSETAENMRDGAK
jgi:cell division protein FtsB